MTREELERRLQARMDEHQRRAPYNGRCAFVWQGSIGTDGVSYGSFRLVSQQELNRREYELEYFDGSPSVTWLDQIYHCGLRRPVRLPTLN